MQDSSQHRPQSASSPLQFASATVQNVGETERLLSLVGGGLLSLYGLEQTLRMNPIEGLLFGALGGSLVYRALTGNCQMYRALGVSSNRDEHPATGVPAQYGVKVEKSVTVHRSAGELYNHWRKLENLPKIMRHLTSVTQTDGRRSRWVAQGPLGVQVEWEAEMINEDPGRLIAWRSLPGSQVDTAGSVHFEDAEGGRGTQVRVSLKYNPPGGQLGAGVAWLMGSGAEQQITEDLQRYKLTMESDEAAKASRSTGA